MPDGDQKKIHARAICAGARVGINRLKFEPRAKDFGCAVHVRHIDFNLLDTFSKFFKKTRNRSVSAWLLRGENVQARSAGMDIPANSSSNSMTS